MKVNAPGSMLPTTGVRLAAMVIPTTIPKQGPKRTRNQPLLLLGWERLGVETAIAATAIKTIIANTPADSPTMAAFSIASRRSSRYISY